MLATSCLRDKRLRRYDHMPQGYEYFLSGVLAWLFALMAMWGVVVGVYVIIHGRGRSRALRVIIFVLGWVLFVFPLIALLATLLPSGNISSAGPVFALGLLCLEAVPKHCRRDMVCPHQLDFSHRHVAA
jgi:ABC-type proline/glycine betaine transport system permease subunit